LYKTGVASANPINPTLVRNDDVHELQLAEIFVRSGVQSITQADILDTRLNNAVCGIVTGLVYSVDTTELFNQYEVYLNQKIAEWNITKVQQGADWQGQMTSQQSGFNTQKNEIQGWYDSVKVDIAKLQTFDFDNVSSFTGCNLVETKVGENYLSEIRLSANNVLVADKTESKNGEDYISVIKVYAEGGITVERTITIVESKIPSGGYKTTITETR